MGAGKLYVPLNEVNRGAESKQYEYVMSFQLFIATLHFLIDKIFHDITQMIHGKVMC